MKLPLQITFRNVKSSAMVEEWIREEAAKLETFYNRIIGCRVAVEVPHRHHKKGKPLHVRIDLTLPGKEIVIKREPVPSSRSRMARESAASRVPPANLPHHDLRLVIHAAFKAAGRSVQDFARCQRGNVKKHEPNALGFVSRLLPEQGYGFLEVADGREVYFHKQSVLHDGFRRLKVGSPVSFSEQLGDQGPQATTVRAVRPQRTASREGREKQTA